ALAQQKLQDIWQLTAVEIKGKQFLLPGPRSAFIPTPDQTILNPSYFSPYAYRLFAQVDPSRDWAGLVEDGYGLIEDMAAFSSVGLPADWIVFNPKTEEFGALPPGQRIQTVYSFDAYRLWWRLSLDRDWFDSASARTYLNRHLPYLIQRWKKDKAIPAVLALDGTALVDYEATSQYAMLYPAIKPVDRQVAFELFSQKLLGNYSRGLWDNPDAYYSQNLAWFALLPSQGPRQLLKPVR
ncbi:MAG: glycosyl hydrolase, partial [Synechococcales cyanobacterium RM1_1_8]|nr:glycosyl hydrolase [Synechococcales cyanobacterium RM1_1_8]